MINTVLSQFLLHDELFVVFVVCLHFHASHQIIFLLSREVFEPPLFARSTDYRRQEIAKNMSPPVLQPSSFPFTTFPQMSGLGRGGGAGGGIWARKKVI